MVNLTVTKFAKDVQSEYNSDETKTEYQDGSWSSID